MPLPHQIAPIVIRAHPTHLLQLPLRNANLWPAHIMNLGLAPPTPLDRISQHPERVPIAASDDAHVFADLEALQRERSRGVGVVDGHVDDSHEASVGEDVQGEAAERGAFGANVEDVVCDCVIDAAGTMMGERREATGPCVREIDAQVL